MRGDWGRGRGNACEINFKKLMKAYQQETVETVLYFPSLSCDVGFSLLYNANREEILCRTHSFRCLPGKVYAIKPKKL